MTRYMPATWAALSPGDIIECGTGAQLHRWRVLGVYLGALGTESLVEMESETHCAGQTDEWEYHPRLFVPEIILREVCRRIPKEVAR